MSTTTQKYSLCFLEDATYERWMEVFEGWEQRKLIMKDGKKPDGCLRDSEMMMLADAILAKEVSIKSNKISGGQ